MSPRPPLWLCALLLLALLPACLYAQRPTGTVAGVITDASGAVVPRASVTIVNKANQFTSRKVTSGTGVYNASGLLPGMYEVRVETPGFKTHVVELKVEVGRVTTANVQLQVGAVTQRVTVQAQAVQVNLTQTALEGIVTGELIRELPLNGRNFLELGQLEPGVQLNPTTLIVQSAHSKLSMGGQSGLTTRVTVDGLDISDEHAGAAAQNISQDSIQEFQISRSTPDASTGLTGSGAVNIVTKSGTNALHGSGFFFWRDDKFAARIGQEPAPFDREQGGFHAGGPLVRNHLFWFLSYERDNQDAAVATEVPGFPQFSGMWPFPFDERMANARLDWNARRNVRAFFRFTHNWNDVISNNTLGGSSLSPLDNSGRANQTAAGMDMTHERFTHSIRFGYLNYDNVYGNGQGKIPGLPKTLDPAGRLVLVNFGGGGVGGNVGPWANAPGRRYHDTHELRYDGGVSLGRHALRWGSDVNFIRINWFESNAAQAPTIRIQVATGTRTACGTNVLCYPFNGVNIGNGMGYWTELPCHGLRYGCISNNRVHWYVADSWRVTPRLNINFGVRYVYESGPDNADLQKPAIMDQFLQGRSVPNRRDKNNFAPQLGMAWDPTGGGKWVVRAGAGIFFDTNLLKHVIFERNNALPLGITQELVNLPGQILRDPVTLRVIFDINGLDLTALVTPGRNWITGCSDPRFPTGLCPLGTPGLIDAVLAAQQAFQAAYKIAYANFPSGPSRCEIRRGGCETFGSNYTTPYSFQFHIGVQRELRPGLVLSVDYVRNRGLHLLTRQDQNRLGAADTLITANALVAMNAVHAARGCPQGPAGVDCAINKGVLIGTYASRGLGLLQNASTTAVNNSAFPGRNANFNRMQFFGMQGVSTYNALHANLRGKLPNLRALVKDWSVVASYALGRFETKGTFEDPALVNYADNILNDKPLDYRGPAALDRTHMLSVGSLFRIPGGIRLNSIWRAFSALPQTVFVPGASGGAAEIFLTDLNGDGFNGDLLPGTNRGSYGRKIGCGATALNRVIDDYNSTQAGNLTPAGQALVNAGLFTTLQLQRLGAVSPTVARAPDGQVCLDSFITTDVRVSRPFKLRSERITVEPAFEWFNLFNVANYDLPGNKLSDVLTGAAGSLNGTTTANRSNRAGFGGGSFALGTPRSWQIVVRVSF